jgi:hypothetical protein
MALSPILSMQATAATIQLHGKMIVCAMVCCGHSLSMQRLNFYPLLQVPMVDSPVFWDLMDKMVSVNNQLSAISKGTSKVPGLLQPVVKLGLYERMASLLLRVLVMKPIQAGSWDFEAQSQLQY